MQKMGIIHTYAVALTKITGSYKLQFPLLKISAYLSF